MNIICDLDGTIALDHKRNHFLHKSSCVRHKNPESFPCTCEPADRMWKEYFDACDTDEPCLAVTSILNAVAGLIVQPKIWILSGRSMSASEKTIAWLARHHVQYDVLQMRSVEDRTDDHILKLRWAKELGLTPQNTLLVFEDRQRVVEAWRENGFRCFQVAPGNF